MYILTVSDFIDIGRIAFTFHIKECSEGGGGVFSVHIYKDNFRIPSDNPAL